MGKKGKEISDVVLEYDIYGDEDLWSKFFKKSGKTRLYFFTKLKKGLLDMERGKHKGTNPFILTITKSTTSVLSGLFHFFPKKPNNGQR